METKLFTDHDIAVGVKNVFAAVLNRNSIPVYDGRFITREHSFKSLSMTDAEKDRVLFMIDEQFDIDLPKSARQCGTVKSVIGAVTKALKSAKRYEAEPGDVAAAEG